MVLGLLCILLLACGNSRETAGGSGTETEATISGVVFAEGRPVASAQILLRNGSVSRSEVLDSTRSDSQGRWLLSGVSAGAWSLEMRAAGQQEILADWARITIADDGVSSGSHTAYLRPLAHLQGVLLDGNGKALPNTLLKILGRGDSVSTDAGGVYNIDNLPPGAYWIDVNGRVMPTRTGNRDTLYLDDRQRIEDFEDDSHDMVVEAGRWSGKGGWWYALQNDSSLSVLPMLTDDPDGNGNHLLHFRFDIPRNEWALAGFMAYADTSSPENWCAFERMEFRVRGEGLLRIQLQTASTLRDNGKKHFEKTFRLSDAWKVGHVRMDSLNPVNGAMWNASCHDVRFVNFVANDTLELWLDDIVLR